MNATPELPELDARPQGQREWSGYLRSLILPLGLVVAIVVGLLYLQSRDGSSGADSIYGTVELTAADNVTGEPPSPTAGRAAPNFLLPSLDGTDVHLSDLQGQPVLVNFWASWCVSCRQEMPDLIKAYESNKTSGLVVIGVNLREADERARSFLDNFGATYPVVFDRRGQVARTWRIGGPTEGLPSSYFIDARGVIQKVVYGTLTAKDLQEGLRLIGAN